MENVNHDTGEVSLATKFNDDLAPAAAALQAQSLAMVQARVLLALKNPRDLDVVRAKILKECKRPGFADAAVYAKPMGNETIEGPSIRFAEAMMRTMGNMLVEAFAVSEDQDQRTVRVLAMDLESNSTETQDVVVEKTTERHNPSGREVIRTRTNKQGKAVYIVRTTGDEMLAKENALVSKARRNKILALTPADIVEEAMEQCAKTTTTRDAQDPDAARRKLLDAFVGLGVQPTELKDYIGHPLEQLTPVELKGLQALYQGIKQGETTWKAAMDLKQPKEDKKAEDKPKGGSKAERMAQELNKPPLPPEPGSDG